MKTPNPLFARAQSQSERQWLAAALGFEYLCVWGQAEIGSQQDLDAWEPNIPAGFLLAGKYVPTWPEGAQVMPYAFVVSPCTPLAASLWLLSLGWQEQAAPLAPVFAHDTAEGGLEGWHETRALAADAGWIAAVASKREQFKTVRLVRPLASALFSGDDVLGELSLAAMTRVGERPEEWPSYSDVQRDQFVDAFALLLDGWAAATGNRPGFGIEPGDERTHSAAPDPAQRLQVFQV